jgi:hypothetical protein
MRLARARGGVAFQQEVAPHPMQFGVERAMPGPFGRRQRFAEDSEGSVHVARTGFGFGEGNLDEPVPDQGLSTRRSCG